MFKRLLCLLAALLLSAFPLVALGEAAFTMAGFDGEGSSHDWATNAFFTRMEERTGLSFTFNEYTASAQWQAAKDKMFASGELPDVLFKAALTTDELIRYTESGQLIDLKPLLEANAPHLWALLEQNPDWLTAVTLPSGKIGALPALQPVATQDVLWINQTWLDALGLSAPTDFASLTAVLTAFRDGDPNHNGKKDEIPLAFLGPWELKLFSHAYGVVTNDYNIYLDEAGQVHYWPNEDSFFDLAAQLRELYSQKLLAQDGFQTSDVLRRLTDDDATVCFGAFFAPTPVSLVTYNQSKAYTAVMPFVYEGRQVYRDLFGQVARGAFAITSACQDPAAMLQWVDVLYTEEGAVEAMLGKEGDAYILTDEGYWQWKGGIDSVTSTQLNALSIYDTGEMPWLFPQAFYDRYSEDTIRRVNGELDQFSRYVKQPFPVYTLTQSQSAQLLPLQNALGRYVDDGFARFILGETPLDGDSIAAFRQGLEELGMTQMISFWQSVANQ